ncbi:DUF1036 domain-containing protein [Mesorhizobium sp. B2-3-5]|uniref:DUF1036 domain-containing protein n=1 Tax=Mesorhizobium sp. B2-3-5 TaxID=2589958 RepID=UPI001129833A|nr:DUF1036 domain-containing protein [Mesorhizobium sp. B2-3-5]TPM27576.1 DUF1036 domain-containing protein [Mesorhizobium sp. B2-3-5]
MDRRYLHSFRQALTRTGWFRFLLGLSAHVAFSAPFGAALLFILSTNSAHAEFTVCNQTLDVVNLAVGQKVDNADQTDGWWTIGANQCVNVIREELTNRYIYLYATDVFGHAILDGSTEMCVDRRRFSIRGIEECWQRGHIAARFVEVDTLEQVRWTYFLTGNSP